MTDPRQTDEALWQALQQSEPAAFEALYHRYWPQIFTTAFSYLKDRHKCMEIVHDIFLNIWQARERLQIHHFASYLQTAARYHVYKALKAEAASISKKQLTETNLASVNLGEEKIRYIEFQQAVDKHMNKLPDRCVEIFNLSRKELLSNDEIASQLGISKRTVENQITHALQHLRVFIRS